ncbi:Hypothetical predicted protein [Octopus vulgaris]|uniref:Uncharacterized protein n=1 Tax=Octopus vulgaris TaxID=6645 RepID=A0AA36B400_OCTVU|nr:Hypothetical predicted protein [Octopus vulgaris]
MVLQKVISGQVLLANFPRIYVGPPIPVFPEEIVKDLSIDQSYAYHIAQAIRSGEVPQTLASLEIGPLLTKQSLLSERLKEELCEKVSRDPYRLMTELIRHSL